MRSKRQKLLNTFVSVGSEANHHCWRDQFVGTVKNRGIFFLFFLIFFSACFAGGVCESLAAIYYVKNGGNDKLAGTSDATAWATIAKVQATVRSGDIVYFRSQDTWAGQATLLTTKAGVTYDGASYGSGTRATLRATSTSSTSQAVIRIGASNVSIKGFDVDGGDQRIGGIQIGGYAGAVDISDISIDNCIVHDIGYGIDTDASWQGGIDMCPRNSSDTLPHRVDRVTITNTTVHDVVRDGIAAYPAWGKWNGNVVNDVIIRGCTVYNAGRNGDQGAATYGVGIHIKSNSDNVTVEYCTLYNNANNGILVETFVNDPGVAPNNMRIRYNIVKGNAIHGIYIHNGSHEIITGDFYGNIFYDNCSSTTGYCAEVYIVGNHDHKTSVYNFYNNTFYSTANTGHPYAMAVGCQGAGAPKGTPTVRFKNNIIYMRDYDASPSVPDMPIWDGGSFLEHSNNLIFRSTMSDSYVYDGMNNYTGSNVHLWEPTLQNTDPLFTGGVLPTGFIATTGGGMMPNTDFFNISSGNAINNGATLGGPYDGCVNWTGTEDMACRPAGAYDIGAYEIPTVVNAAPRTKISKLK